VPRVAALLWQLTDRFARATGSKTVGFLAGPPGPGRPGRSSPSKRVIVTRWSRSLRRFDWCERRQINGDLRHRHADSRQSTT